jgi:hypothetical protein
MGDTSLFERFRIWLSQLIYPEIWENYYHVCGRLYEEYNNANSQ